MPQDLKTCVVSIRSLKKKGAIVGTGFVVDGRHILTCAHVVNMANAGHGDELLVVFAANDRQQPQQSGVAPS